MTADQEFVSPVPHYSERYSLNTGIPQPAPCLFRFTSCWPVIRSAITVSVVWTDRAVGGRTQVMKWMVRYGLLVLMMVSMCGRAAHAETAADTDGICQTVEHGVRLHVDGVYGGYPHSVLRDAVLESVACPSDEEELRAFHLIGTPPPHMRISVMRPTGQGQQGSLSVMLFSQGHFVIGERMSLSVFSRSQSPFSVKADINLATQRLWSDLAARIARGGPVIP